MLTPGIAEAYAAAPLRLRDVDGVRVVAQGSAGGDDAPAPQLVEATSLDGVTDEVFGASGVVVRYDRVDDLVPHLEALEGQLTATVHATARRRRCAEAAAGAGAEGWTDSVQRLAHRGRGRARHGSRRSVPGHLDCRTTSVGSLAIERFQRPVAYQDVPADLLPDAVRDDNPWGLSRRIDGELRLP